MGEDSKNNINNATLAQLVEQLIRNEQVVGSSPMSGSYKICLLSFFYFSISFIFVFLQITNNYLNIIYKLKLKLCMLFLKVNLIEKTPTYAVIECAMALVI